ncbi:MAG TPA: alkaline phosphatase family protein [Anaerolineales bacterium]
MDANFVKPRYDLGGFASLPQRITDLLTDPQKYEAVVLFLLDGFGWRFFEKFQEAPFLKTVTRLGQVEKLIAQFPSTTAAQLTTLHTGMPVGEHGIFEWIYYEPHFDAIIAPLLFSFAGTSLRDTLKQVGAKPRRLFPNNTLYQQLNKMGINSTIFQHREYTPSSYGDVIFSGAKAIGYKTLPEALVNLAEALEKSNPTPAYYVLYNEKIDAVSHEYGPDSAQTSAEIQVLLLTMETIFLKALRGNHRKILFLLTADHGQSETDPQTTIYLNREPRFEGIEKFLKTNRQGSLLVPGGSARDFFLYIQAGMVEEAQAFLTSRLEGRAEVRKVADLASEGYFGPRLSPRFTARAGDLVILPHRYESVWWYEKNKYEQRYCGHHGGLTPQEMEIPLLTWEM